MNISLVNELYNSTLPEFDDLLITHPSIFAVEIVLYKVLTNIGIIPDYLVGVSLGEFAAAVANGIWDEKTAVEAAAEQAKVIEREIT